MALTTISSSLVQCPKPYLSPLFSPKNYTILRATSAHNLRFPKIYKMNKIAICAASSSAAGTGSSNSDCNPYEVLGVSPIEGFDMVKAAYAKKKKDAEKRGDEATAIELEKAYDKIMMAQLTKRKKGETFGSFKVSKDIRYADKLPVVPWGPRPSKSDAKDIKINMAISAVFLKAFEPAASPTFTEEGEDEGRMLRMGKRLLRSLLLVFGCIAVASLGYTGILNLIEVAGGYIPRFLYNNQELFITASTALILYVMASFYR